MNKLTLSIDKRLVAKVKKVARKRGTNVSAMFSHFIEALPNEDDAPISDSKTDLPPITRAAMGIVKLPRNANYRDLITKAMSERHK